jgi:hypothetical protein
MSAPRRWIQTVHPKKGALHRQLGIAPSRGIPTRVLDRVMAAPVGGTVTVRGRAVRVTPLLKKRVTFARNVRVRRG